MGGLLNPKGLKSRLSRIVFCIEGKDEEGHAAYGTGFFITTTGMALTAFHNLPAEVRRRREGTVNGRFNNKAIELQWRPSSGEDARWQEILDVAVLQGPGGIVRQADLIPCMHLPVTLTRQQRAEYWSARPVGVAGYFFDRPHSLGGPVIGTVSADEPIQDPVMSHTGALAEEALAFGADFERQLVRLGGISGAPVYDRILDAVVAVEFAVSEDPDRIYARELHHAAKYLSAFSNFSSEIREWRTREKPHWRSRLLAAVFIMISSLGLWSGRRLFWPAGEPVPPAFTPADLVLSYSVQRWSPERLDLLTLSRENTFRAGDRIRFRLSSPQSGHLYLFNQTGGSHYTILFPTPSTNGGSSRLRPNVMLLLPGSSWMEMDTQKGREKFWLVYSRIRLEQLERLQRYANHLDLGAVRAPDNELLRDFLQAPEERRAKARAGDGGKTEFLFGRGWSFVHLLEL